MSNGTARVNFLEEDIVSNPLQVITSGAKGNKFSIPFAINEQVACLMDENLEFGVILGAVYDAKNTPPGGASAQSVDLVFGANKVQIKIDSFSGSLTLEVDGDVTVKCSNASIEGDLSVTGTIEATGDVKAGTISLMTHTHTSAASGSPTSTPIP